VQLKQALTAAVEHLESSDCGSPRMNAETLLMFVLGVNRAYLYAHPERELTAEEQARYDKVIAQRAAGVPSQYITGHQEFWGLDFVVTPLALANEIRGADVYAVDLSVDALEAARANAARLQLDGRVKFLHSDVLSALADRHDFDFVISNPPYVGNDEADKVQRSVFEFEPRMAVFAGENGLDVIRPLIEQAHTALKPGGWLAVEIGYSMRDAVLALLDPTLWDEPMVVPDLQGIPRVIAARKR